MSHNPHHYHHHLLPCLQCHPHSYIRMVQHLIERCLLLRMDRDQCIKALADHAKIRPLITLTVWRELLKENRDFFQAYYHGVSPRPLMSRHVQRSPRFTGRRCWTRRR
uniref:Angiotensin-converting enzyme 2 n=1 Tax=Opuntia streptacantha TaxID=393608 RepID=A0A7C8YD16_OPUST